MHSAQTEPLTDPAGSLRRSVPFLLLPACFPAPPSHGICMQCSFCQHPGSRNNETTQSRKDTKMGSVLSSQDCV